MGLCLFCFSLVMFISDNESFNPSLWEEQRKQRAQVAFECDEDKDEREAPPRVSLFCFPSNFKPVSWYLLGACMLNRFSQVWLFATVWTISLPGSSVHGVLQARILEWTAVSSSRGSSQPCASISCIGRRVLYH